MFEKRWAGERGLDLRSRGESWRMLLIFPFLPLEIRAFEHQDATFFHNFGWVGLLITVVNGSPLSHCRHYLNR